MIIEEKIAEVLPEFTDRINNIVKKYPQFKVCDVTVEQITAGIRGVQIQVSDISYVDPYEGIRFRGYTVPETLKLLPKKPGMEYPLMGGLYFLLMTSLVPTYDEALAVEDEWRQRAKLPHYVYTMLKNMPHETHPMTLFSQAIMALQTESVFAKKYAAGLAKKDYWKYFLEDSMTLTARLPAVGAYIYSLRYNGGKIIEPEPGLDWSANFAHMIGKSDHTEYHELCRLFFLLHSDHEGAPVSTHTSHLVGSALSDPYLAVSAGMNGLAGPLHGLANQECIRWLLNVRSRFNHTPTEADVEGVVNETLNSGQVVPGYGHAVLRVTDPRFTAQADYAEKYLPDDELYHLVKLVYKVVPSILKNNAKIKNPYPNVDAINGTLQYHYGVKEFDFYTVLFGISRACGITTHLVWARALGKPIERPKSLTTQMLEDQIRASGLEL